LILAGAERRHHDRLRLAAGEQRGAVRARQNAHLADDGTDGLGVAPVDARLALEDGAAHDVLLDLLERLGRDLARRVIGEQRLELDLGGLDTVAADLLLTLAIGGGQIAAHRVAHLTLDLFGFWRGRRQIPGILGGLFRELDDRLQHRLELLVAEHDGAEHDILGKLLGFRLHHEHAFLRAGNDEVELRVRHLVELGIEYATTVDIADTGATDGSKERDARQRQRRRGADQGDDIGIVLQVVRQHGADDLRLVAEARREQRPDRPVDEARGQRLLLRGTAFALEEAARDLAGRKCLLLVVDGEREKILPRFRLLHPDGGAQYRRLAISRHHRAVGLARNLARLEHEAAAAPHQLFAEYVEHLSFPSFRNVYGPRRGRPSRPPRLRARNGLAIVWRRLSGVWTLAQNADGRRSRSAAGRQRRSATQPQALDHLLVAGGIGALQIVELAAALADHDQKAAAR